jgi:hypothetical protein
MTSSRPQRLLQIDPLDRKEQEEFVRNYLTPELLCGKPGSVSEARWVLKSLSNDQTAFTGFTSLVDVRGDTLGYDGQIKLVPNAAFVEPFVLKNLDVAAANRLEDLRTKLSGMDSTKVPEINELLEEAERIAPVQGRTKGKSPIFFYSVTDKMFNLPKSFYDRMATATEVICEGLSFAATNFNSSLDTALFDRKTENTETQFYTGSIDFMVFGDQIYVVDVGSPAVGYVADIVFASDAVGVKPELGMDDLASALGSENSLYAGKSNELGFFKLETSSLVDGVRGKGKEIEVIPGGLAEVEIDGVKYPTEKYDFISRNQPLRNKVLRAMQSRLTELGVYVPQGVVTTSESMELSDFYQKTKLGEDLGIIVKKKVLFGEYQRGSGYFKPLVVPIWDRELLNNKRSSTLFEQFIPSLMDMNIAGMGEGKRCYEIRMYYCAGKGK